MRSQIIKIATLALAFTAILTACGKKTPSTKPNDPADDFTLGETLEIEIDNGTIAVEGGGTTETFEVIDESGWNTEPSGEDGYDGGQQIPGDDQTDPDGGQNVPETTAKKTEETKPPKETEKPAKNEDPCKTGHKYSSWTTVIEATCKREGELSRVCSVCNHEETKTVDKSGHNPVSVPGKSATCTKEGLTDGTKCADCDKVITKQEKIPKISHSFGNWTTAAKPTCAAEGQETRKCVNCNAVETNTLPKSDDHSYKMGKCTACNSEQPPTSNLSFALSEDGKSYYCDGFSNHHIPQTIIIPATYNGKPVIGVTGLETFSTHPKEIILPEGIEWIGRAAFWNAEITTIVIPSTVNRIHGWAFNHCDSLETVYFSHSLWEMGSKQLDFSDPYEAANFFRNAKAGNDKYINKK